MRELKIILKSIIESYNNKEVIKFRDLNELHSYFKDSKLICELIELFNEEEKLNFTHVRDLEILINKR